jgi:thioredoxin-related protein
LSKDSVQEELSRSYNFYTVDLTNPTRETEERARKMGVTGIPVMIRFDAKGKETDRTYALPPDQLINWLKAGE